MAYKKKKYDMSREELENRLELQTVELSRAEKQYARLRLDYDKICAVYAHVPKWARRRAEKQYEKLGRRKNK